MRSTSACLLCVGLALAGLWMIAGCTPSDRSEPASATPAPPVAATRPAPAIATLPAHPATAPAGTLPERPATTAPPATQPATDSAPATAMQDMAYAIGLKYGRELAAGMRGDKVDLDKALVLEGFTHGLQGTTPRQSDEQANQALKALTNLIAQQAKAQRERLAEKNRQEGQAYLTENAERPGVTVLPSGVQMELLQPAEGPKPDPDDTVKVHYRGTLVDGTEFDSSHRRGQPAEFALNRVIRGWGEALQHMPVGSKYRIVVPSDLAYGPAGRMRSEIGPDATLIFEVELLEILPPATAPATLPAFRRLQ